MLLLEIQMTLNTDFDILTGLLPSWTPHEKMSLLHKLFASVFSACRILSQATYEDEEAAERQRLALIHENTKAAVALLLSVHNQLAAMKLSKAAATALNNANNANSSASATVGDAADDDEPVVSTSAPAPLPAAPDVLERLQRAQELLGAQGGLRDGAPMRGNAPGRGHAHGGAAVKERNPLWSLVSYAVVPIVLNYLLNR